MGKNAKTQKVDAFLMSSNLTRGHQFISCNQGSENFNIHLFRLHSLTHKTKKYKTDRQTTGRTEEQLRTNRSNTRSSRN